MKLPASALFAVAALLAVAGCASVGDRLAERLTSAILDQDDPETVRQGAPAYLLLVDGLIEDDPEDVGLLLAGARLYGSYAAVFVDDPWRAQRLTARARGYATRALCAARPADCELARLPFESFAARLGTFVPGEAELLYSYGAAWIGWIQARADDWNAIADLPKVEVLMQRVVALDETRHRGGAHLYLGVLTSLRPPAAGGKPEAAREHFERAITLSRGEHLMAKVLYAEHYARARFDRDLHDRLLREVLAAEPRAPDLTLSNTLAQQKARQLLATAEQYF